MGQKCNPVSFRIISGYKKIGSTEKGIWKSMWYSDPHSYKGFFIEDLQIREYLTKEYKDSYVSDVVIKRSANMVIILIYTSRPRAILERKSGDIEKVKKEVSKLTKSVVSIQVLEVKNPDSDASLVAQSIAKQLEGRGVFKKVMKRSIQSAMRIGVKGVKIACSGRLGGAEIARTEWYKEGRIPLHTIKADIDYATATAFTKFGAIGVKVWIHKDEKKFYS